MNEEQLRKKIEENSKNIIEALKQDQIDYLKSKLEYTENMLKYQQGIIKDKPIDKTYKYVEEDFYYSNYDKNDFYYDKEDRCYYIKDDSDKIKYNGCTGYPKPVKLEYNKYVSIVNDLGMNNNEY